METKEILFFLDACRRGDAEDVGKMCTIFPELINESNDKGFTPLIMAAYSKQPAIVQLLLQHKANPDLGDRHGNTALMGAAFKGYPEIVKVLLDGGANVNVVNGQNATALTFAATFGQMEIAEDLIKHGAVTNAPDKHGHTPLHHAQLQNNEAMQELLLRNAGSETGH